jgi:hypothetical protein
MSTGFYKRRRGILEHLEAGTISLLDLAVHDYLNLKANLVIGGDSSIPPGVVITSAVAIHLTCPNQISEKAVQRSLQHLEKIGWIKRWNVPGRHGNYPILVCRGSVHDLSGNEYRISGEDTKDWRDPKWSVSGNADRTVQLLSTDREVRSKNKEKPCTPDGFDAFWKSYPKKVGKPAALKAWAKVKPLEVALVLKGIDAWKKSEQWVKGRVWDPVNFLNHRHWEDEIPGPVQMPIAIHPRRRNELTEEDRAVYRQYGVSVQ